MGRCVLDSLVEEENQLDRLFSVDWAVDQVRSFRPSDRTTRIIVAISR